MEKQIREKLIARKRLLDIGLSEKLLDSQDIITDKYAIIIGWNGVVFHNFKPEIFISVTCFKTKARVKRFHH